MSYWKFIFDAKSPTWTSYGRVLFVQADTEPLAKEAAILLAQADFQQSEILPIAIGASTPEAARLFAAKKRGLAAWQENNKRSIPNDRSVLDGSASPAPLPDAAPVAWRSMESAPKAERYVIIEDANANRVLAHYMPGGFCIEDHPAIDEGWYFWTGRMYDRFEKPVRWKLAHSSSSAAKEKP